MKEAERFFRRAMLGRDLQLGGNVSQSYFFLFTESLAFNGDADLILLINNSWNSIQTHWML